MNISKKRSRSPSPSPIPKKKPKPTPVSGPPEKPKDKIKGHTWGGARDRVNTVRQAPELLWELLTLDPVSAGDAALIVAKKNKNESGCVACVIDGGHEKDGRRLFAHTEALHKKGIETTHCIISHFDLDHWYGVGTWLTLMQEKNRIVNIITPIIEDQMTNAGDYKADNEQSRFAKKHKYHRFLNYNKQEFDLGILKFSEVSGQDPCTLRTECKNSNSLRWHVRCVEGMGVNFYTGGDGEKGLPINATILKLDHHGGATKSSNSGLRELNRTLVHIISGPGRGFDHPEPSVDADLTHHKTKYDDDYKVKNTSKPAKQYKIRAESSVLATSIHFDDQAQRTKTGASDEYYGDILLRIYSNGSIQSQFCGCTKKWLTNETNIGNYNYDAGWLGDDLQTIGKRDPLRKLERRSARGTASTVAKTVIYKCGKEGCDQKVSLNIETKTKDPLCDYHYSEFVRVTEPSDSSLEEESDYDQSSDESSD